MARGDYRAALLRAARLSFLEKGYGATSMSSIAAAVGGSKTTLWARFPSKPAIFAAVIDEMALEYAVEFDIDLSATLEEQLRHFGVGLLRTKLSEPVLGMHRLVVAEMSRFPELSRIVFERGRKVGLAQLQAIIENAMEIGELRSGNEHAAAHQFTSLCQAGLYEEALFGLAAGSFEIEYSVEAALACFMHGWSLRSTGSAA